ncbi:MAG: FAD-dependent oxidoreductase [Thermoanaerobaculia bacterium]
MSEPGITVYGAFWCPDCRVSKQFLGEQGVPYNWVNIEEDKKGEQFITELNNGKRVIPTITFEDGSFMVFPSNAQLAEKLGLVTKAERAFYDLIVLGAGPAGLMAALYAEREAIETLVIERAAIGGQAASTEKLDNVPGFPESVTGQDFSGRLRQQAEKFGAEILQAQEVSAIRSDGNYHYVTTQGGSEYSANSMVIASGSRYRRLGVAGEEAYLGAGVHFCATCDGPFYKGKEVAVIGGGNSAAEESLLLTRFAEKVTVLVREDKFQASPIIQDKVLSTPKIEVKWNTEVKEFIGADSHLNKLRLANNQTGEGSEFAVDGVFIFIGTDPNTGFLADTPIALNKWGYVVTGHDLVHAAPAPEAFKGREPAFLETSVPGVFAAGDVRSGSTNQVVSAAGEGAAAALMVRDYLKRV